ncbi:P-loop containing nucleoside triphosphate hydrolases superfamily protein [Hibiscus syriacus]|uniref:P-loop containing nucleoside triphosphate hydrolases superfamily protein n=1 Tax=Hibiscus syriacus TaxID=106335 RepID=A0A6A2XUU1_HIBSY|nr:protein SRC2-like [Hibiscus syriacus]KAE8679288.1 P-loop containing nucleoside triphosphate hydrolases superfamily protein [Hibiscus syriacus]
MELRVNLMYAKDLKHVNLITKMKVYGVVSINGNPRTNQKTPVDKENGSNPEWNCRMKFIVDEAHIHQNLIFLVFALKSSRMLWDRDIGNVQVSVRELLHQTNGNHMVDQNVSYTVVLPDGKSRGILNFSYRFVGNLNGTAPFPQLPGAVHEIQGGSPVLALASPQHGGSYPYHPPHGTSMYPYPTPHGMSMYHYPTPHEMSMYPYLPAYGYHQGRGPVSGYGYQQPPQCDSSKPPKQRSVNEDNWV